MEPLTSEMLHNVLKSLSQTDTAWTTASTAGAAHVQAVCNALLTFGEVALLAPASVPAPGHLSVLHASATESLRWLRTTITRLSSALRGALQIEETIADAAVKEERSLSGNEWTEYLQMKKWCAFVKDINVGFEKDLEAKRGIMHVLQQSVVGGYAKREELEVCVATWLEQPERVPGKANVLVAAFEAEKEAVQDLLMSSETSPKVQRPASNGRNVEKVESPAIAMLRQAKQGKKK